DLRERTRVPARVVTVVGTPRRHRRGADGMWIEEGLRAAAAGGQESKQAERGPETHCRLARYAVTSQRSESLQLSIACRCASAASCTVRWGRSLSRAKLRRMPELSTRVTKKSLICTSRPVTWRPSASLTVTRAGC